MMSEAEGDVKEVAYNIKYFLLFWNATTYCVKWTSVNGALFSIFHYFEPTWPIFYCYWTNFQFSKWPKIEQIILPYGHIATNE